MIDGCECTVAKPHAFEKELQKWKGGTNDEKNRMDGKICGVGAYFGAAAGRL